MKFPDFPDFLDLWILGEFLESARYVGGIPDHMRSILVEYQPERSHVDLIRTKFHDFVPILTSFDLFICYVPTIYLLYRIYICDFSKL